jgi:integrase
MTRNLIPMTQDMTILKKPVISVSPEDKDSIKKAIDTWMIQAKANKVHKNIKYIAERDKLLVEWLFNTGMRISDALSIKYRDIDMQKETVTFKVNKRSKKTAFIHTIPLDKSILFEVQRFKEMYLQKPDEEIFKLTRQTFDDNLAKYCKIAGIRKYSAHKFRHGCAMNDLRSGLPDFVTAHRLAHSSTSITNSIYRRMDAEIERAFRKKETAESMN